MSYDDFLPDAQPTPLPFVPRDRHVPLTGEPVAVHKIAKGNKVKPLEALLAARRLERLRLLAKSG